MFIHNCDYALVIQVMFVAIQLTLQQIPDHLRILGAHIHEGRHCKKQNWAHIQEDKHYKNMAKSHSHSRFPESVT